MVGTLAHMPTQIMTLSEGLQRPLPQSVHMHDTRVQYPSDLCFHCRLILYEAY
jgi:hypothetical protein